MPGPSVMVRVLGDVSGLANSYKQSGEQATSAASKAHAAFSNMLGMLNQSGVLGPFGEALATADEGLQQLGEHGKTVSDTLIGAGGTLVAVGGLFSALGSKEQAAHQQLAQAIENTGHSYSDYASQIDEAIKHQEKFGNSSEETQQALQALTQATNDPAKALQLLNTASDLAAAKHESLSSAATQLGKVYNGNTKLLKEFGIQVTATATLQKQATSASDAATKADQALATAKQKLSDLQEIDSQKSKLTLADQIALRNAQDAVTTATQNATAAHQKAADAQTALQKATTGSGTAIAQLSDKLKGQAAAAADTFTGHLKAIKTEVEDQAAKFGEKYGPALQGAGAAMAGLGTAIKITQAAVDLFTASEEAATTATEATTAAEVAADTAGLPLIATLGLIVLAVAALVAIGIVIYKNWTTIWAGMKDAAEAVFDWIRTNWPLLVAILTGPIGLAVLAIVKNWDTIKNAVLDAIDFIKAHWAIIVDVLLGPIGVAITQIIQHWQGLVNFFTGIPNDMRHIFDDIWGGILDAFRDVINDVIDVWNKLHFTLPKVDVLGVHIGGGTIGVPQIPHLAQGGLITASGLVYAHAGEAITPIDKVPGPAVNIENAHFSSEVDVDLFMRKAAWVVKTQRV